MPRAAVNLQSLARVHTETCVRRLASIAAKSDSDTARVTAIGMLLDRGWGKAPTTHTGANGEGAIKVVIRHIIEGRDAPRAIEDKVIEHVPIGTAKDE
jgi:hypothetical protein